METAALINELSIIYAPPASSMAMFFRQILPHDIYLINLSRPTREWLEKSREAFIDTMHRCEQLSLSLLSFHPGSHYSRSQKTNA